MSSFRFFKTERLTNKRKFENLFQNGKSINAYPLKLIYVLEPRNSDTVPVQFAFTIPKRSFKKAVDRNFLKRRIKETFRLNKHRVYNLLAPKEMSIYGIFIFIEKEKRSFHEIDKAMLIAISKLEKAFLK